MDSRLHCFDDRWFPNCAKSAACLTIFEACIFGEPFIIFKPEYYFKVLQNDENLCWHVTTTVQRDNRDSTFLLWPLFFFKWISLLLSEGANVLFTKLVKACLATIRKLKIIKLSMMELMTRLGILMTVIVCTIMGMTSQLSCLLFNRMYY